MVTFVRHYCRMRDLFLIIILKKSHIQHCNTVCWVATVNPSYKKTGLSTAMVFLTGAKCK